VPGCGSVYPVAVVHDFLDLRRDHHDADAASRQALKHGEKLNLGADIHAARRFVDQQNRHVHFEPFRENELLLVAT
jgi:hypothetical protein